MVGTHAKGKALEKALARQLRRDLPLADIWVPQMGKFASNDIFCVWDIVYITNQGLLGFVQLCHPNSVKRHIDKIIQWLPRNRNFVCELWTYDKEGVFKLSGFWPTNFA